MLFHNKPLTCLFSGVSGEQKKFSVRRLLVITMSFKQSKFDEKEIELKSVAKSKDEPKKPPDVPPVGVLEIFRFCDGFDKLLIFIGLVSAIGAGVAFPFMFFMFGTMTQYFTNYISPFPIPGLTDEMKVDILWKGIMEFVWKLCALGGGLWVSHYFFVTSLNYAAERQVLRMRQLFFAAVLKQDIAWYDTNTTTDFASTMSEDLNKIQEGLGEKIGMFFRFFVTFLVAFGISFYQNWLLSAVLCAVVPLLIILGGVFGMIITSFSKNELSVYSKAGEMAEEVLSSIRTVIAFGGEEIEVERYSTEIKVAQRSGMIKGFLVSLTMGLMFGLMYGIYGFGFWFGVKQVMDQRETPEFGECAINCILNNTSDADIQTCLTECFDFNPGTVATVLFGILQGGMQIGQSSMFVEAFNTARAAAGKIFKVINRQSLIDSSSFEGIHPDTIKGNIKFNNVFFNYPSRPDVKILNGLSIDIPSGKSVAFVGSSGCGKSTCIQLIQRFYDPESGSINIDGIDIKTLNVKWLRENIGIVGQEPVLFDCTIRENIKYAKLDATDEEILKACKEANALDFISKLPNKLDTMVGEGGAQLSGGQKQRIAIARALIRNPKILLLDEATSALDNASEKSVQTALDNVQDGRTTIIVAHRLSTIRHADLIVSFENGQVKEQGTHAELMKNEGLYHSLVMRQMTGQIEDFEKENSEKSFSKQLSIMSSEEEQVIFSPEKPKAVKKYGNIKILKKLFKMNRPETGYLIFGFLCSAAFGLTNIAFAVLFGDVFSIFVKEPEQAREEATLIALEYGALALYTFLCMLGQGSAFSVAGERLTQRLRVLMYKAMLRQEIGWYDLEENNSGSLCSRLSSNAQSVQSATGVKIGQICQSISALVCGLGLSLYYNWKVGLVSNAFVPILVVGMLYQMLLFTKHSSVQKKALESSSKFAIEAIKNIRTVAGLGCENMFQELYNEELIKPHKKTLKQSHVRGIIYGFANSTFCFAYAVCFSYGGHVYTEDLAEYPPEEGRIMEIWKIGIGVLSGAMMIGMSMSFVMDFNQVFEAAEIIFTLLERNPKIDSSRSAGLLIPEINGNIYLENAEFSYPTRQEVQVMKRLTMSIKNGEKIALVGQSGCGKSTIIQLIQRLYDVENGNVMIENYDIRQLNLPAVRSKLGLVSQEPVLFNRSIAANIMYGDNARSVTMEEVVTAARAANIHSFVAALPNGYETNVGGKGAQLSGGQKQRVAIARALVRFAIN